MDHWLRLSLLLLEFTLCGTEQAKRYHRWDKRKTELRPDKCWDGKFQKTAHNETHTICSWMWFTAFSVCENAVEEFFTLCNMLWKRHPITETYFRPMVVVVVVRSILIIALQKGAAWWSLRWLLQRAWKSAQILLCETHFMQEHLGVCFEVSGHKMRQNSADFAVTSAAREQMERCFEEPLSTALQAKCCVNSDSQSDKNPSC